MRSLTQRKALWIGLVAGFIAVLGLPERIFGEDEPVPRSLFQKAFGKADSAAEMEASQRKSVELH